MQLPGELNLRIFSHSTLYDKLKIRSISQSFNHLIRFVEHVDQVEISSSNIPDFIRILNVILSTDHINQLKRLIYVQELTLKDIINGRIEQLTHCDRLTTLKIHSHVICNFEIFNQMKNLRKLSIYFSGYNSRDDISRLTNIKELEISFTLLSKCLVTELNRLINLKKLTIIQSNRSLKKLRIKNLIQLEELTILKKVKNTSLFISDSSSIRIFNLPKLKYLNIVCSSLTDLQFKLIINCTELKALNIEFDSRMNGKIIQTQFDGIERLKKLKYLKLIGIKLNETQLKNILNNTSLETFIH